MWRNNILRKLNVILGRVHTENYKDWNDTKRHKMSQQSADRATISWFFYQNQLIAVQNNVIRRILCRSWRFNLCNFRCEPGLSQNSEVINDAWVINVEFVHPQLNTASNMIVVYDIIIFTNSWKETICTFVYSKYLQCQKTANHH